MLLAIANDLAELMQPLQNGFVAALCFLNPMRTVVVTT